MKSTRTALIFIFITLLIDMIGIGIIIPVIPTLIQNISGEGLDRAVIYGMWLLSLYAAMQFLFAPLMGELSDRFGRRPILLASLFMMSIDYLIHAFAPTIAWLFFGRIMAGITGASHSVATAYVADISTPENKAKNFGMIGAAFGLGFIIGPAIGGIFGEIDVRLPFLVAAGLTFANFLLGFFFVPESLALEKRRVVQLKKMIPGVSVFNLKQYKGIIGLVFAFFLANVAGQALPSTWSYFTIEQFGWTEAQIGYSLMAVGIMVSIAQGFLVGKLVPIYGQKKVIVWGFVLWSTGMLLFSIASTPWMLYLFIIPYSIGGVAGPTLQSLVSNQVPDNEQGNLQGALTGMVSITAIIGPILASTVFAYFISEQTFFYFPGAAYVVSAVILMTSTVLAWRALKTMDISI
ncbi:MAG: TCR/Tet family MFS transporter [Flavobacteriales bacterium]|nr:TCR/Tet family MFS transporter [Flavobacteriales bacterium]